LNFRKRGWDSAVGSSGTIRSLFEALCELDPTSAAITPHGLDLLIEQFIEAGQVANLPLDSIVAERRPVIAGGLAILVEIFSELGIKRMGVAEGAMREGVLHELVGRFTAEDARERTVRSMQARYQVDLAQAARVEATAVTLLRQVRSRWQLTDPMAELMLRWAARLHEIGLDVAHSGYHRHGAYLLENADMPGFTRDEQLLLARMVRSHRRKLALDGLGELRPPWNQLSERLVVIFRLAVLLHRNRGDSNPPRLTLVPRGRGINACFKLRSLRRHPLTEADLHQEQAHLKVHGIALRLVMAR
jgi:exopolyphosphatase/guanosine-5'-triphosphate,3'-diphosphate pyrophosphatase